MINNSSIGQLIDNNNSNIYSNLLCKDGLHLLYASKELLAKNFVVSIIFKSKAHIAQKYISTG